MSGSRFLSSLSMASLLMLSCSGEPNTTFGLGDGSSANDDDDDDDDDVAGSEGSPGSSPSDDDDDDDDDDDGTKTSDSNMTSDGGDDDDDDADSSPIRFDVGGGTSGDTSGIGVGNCQNRMIGILRDFSDAHPDFEKGVHGEDPGLVEPMLGADGKPVYAGGTIGTTTSKETFDQWFRDDPVNVPLPIAIPLTDPEGDGTYTFQSTRFFPADDQGHGNEGRDHNYHFTLEIRTSFTYEGGEIFQFRGDDDLFVFVNGQLAMDLGGVHLPLTGIVDMDAQAAALGLEIGGSYTLDFFYAERHTTMANFRVDTSIACFVPEG